LDIDKREALTPLVKYFIIRSIFILPSCRNRHRTSSLGQFLFYRPVRTVTGLHLWWRRTSLFLYSF